ncbi:MAG: hypothetical protein ACI9JM_003407 [Halioglobus sp.]|jgi:hypothetical protein
MHDYRGPPSPDPSNIGCERKIIKYSRENPSPRYRELSEMYASMHHEGRPSTNHSADETFDGRSLEPHIATVAGIVAANGAATLLDFGSGKGKLYQDDIDSEDVRRKLLAQWPGVKVSCYDPGYEPYAGAIEGPFDAVISTDVVEHIPEEDIPWLLDELFGHAQVCIYVVAACYPAKKKMPDGSNAHCTIRPPRWWVEQMREASKRNSAIKWTLCTQKKSYFSFEQRNRIYKPGLRTDYFTA